MEIRSPGVGDASIAGEEVRKSLKVRTFGRGFLV
jgi:hypothetical protein